MFAIINQEAINGIKVEIDYSSYKIEDQAIKNLDKEIISTIERRITILNYWNIPIIFKTFPYNNGFSITFEKDSFKVIFFSKENRSLFVELISRIYNIYKHYFKEVILEKNKESNLFITVYLLIDKTYLKHNISGKILYWIKDEELPLFSSSVDVLDRVVQSLMLYEYNDYFICKENTYVESKLNIIIPEDNYTNIILKNIVNLEKAIKVYENLYQNFLKWYLVHLCSKVSNTDNLLIKTSPEDFKDKLNLPDYTKVNKIFGNLFEFIDRKVCLRLSHFDPELTLEFLEGVSKTNDIKSLL